jgi:hypothetical protein
MKPVVYTKVSQLTNVGYEFLERFDGNKYWCLNGLCHREDGPAIEYLNGNKTWYLNGKEITLKTKSNDLKVKKIQEYMKIQEVLEK